MQQPLLSQNHGCHFALKLLDLWNISSQRCFQKLFVVPLRRLFESIARSFHYSLSLGFLEAGKVVLVTLFIGGDPQEIIQSGLCERNTFIHGIKIIWVHGGHQLANQVKAPCVRESLALVAKNFIGFISKVIGLRAIGHDFFRILHPLDLAVLIGATNKCDWIACWVLSPHEKFNNLLLTCATSIWESITKKVPSRGLVLSLSKRVSKLFEGWGGTSWLAIKRFINLGVGVLNKGLRVSTVSLESNPCCSIQKLNSHLLNWNIS
mmetsp:Transcript_16621/g.36361  ORF Transcript_16621/g.36361 Transcript_16621/m.36361 type:complete len:264 (-) Transcript_16621:637-1428(-)